MLMTYSLLPNDKEILHETKRFLSKKFEMKDLSEASFVLGIQIYRDSFRGILGLSQKAYIEKVLERYGMQDCKLGDTSVTKGNKFSLSQCPKNDLEVKKNAENFQCFSCRESNVCSSLHTSRHIVHC